MAIKRKKSDVEGSSLPQDFLDLTRRAFTLQAVAAQYKDAFDTEKDAIGAYLESTDAIQVTLSESLSTPEGQVIMKTRENWKIDTAAIEALIKSGKLSLATILEISNINAPKLKTVLGEAAFKKLATCTETEYLALTATPEFKSSVADQFAGAGAEIIGAAKVAPTSVTEELAKMPASPPSLAESIKKLDALEGKKKFTRAKPASIEPGKATPQDDLDDILKSL